MKLPNIEINIFTLWKIYRWFKKNILRVKYEPKKFSFGKNKPQLDPRTLKMSTYAVAIPDPPESFDNLQVVYQKLGINDPTILYPIDGNDEYGDCTFAGMAHARTTYGGLVGVKNIPVAKDVINAYFKFTCGKDSGCNELAVLKYWRKKGFAGEKPLGFVSIDPKNHTHVKQAIQLFGGVYLGFNVQEQCQNDFENGVTWTPGTLLNEGHAIYAVSYDKDTVTVLTWGNIQKGTWDWWDETVDEAYAILPQEAQTPGFAPGFDLAELQKDIIGVSNSKLNVMEERSKFMSLNTRDFLHGLVYAVGAAVLTALEQALAAGAALDLNLLKKMGLVALATLLSYLSANLFQNKEGKFTFKRDK
jgi:hypothetical protein